MAARRSPVPLRGRAVGALLCKLVGALVLFAVLWTVIAPYYTASLAALVGAIAPHGVALEPAGTEVVYRYTAPTVFRASWTSVDTLTLQGAAPLLATMVVLTPGMPLARRGLGLAAIFAGLLAVHVLVTGVFGWAFLWTVTGTGPFALDALAPYEPLAYIALPALAGGAWCWRYWLPALRDGPTRKGE